MSLTIRGGNLRSVCVMWVILGKEGLCSLGFDLPMGKVMAQQAIMLNRVEEELPSASDVDKADDIELQEIMENTVRSTEDLIAQLVDPPGIGTSFAQAFGVGQGTKEHSGFA